MKIAIIPARGGSKRLPGKNIKSLAGKPMIAWTIEAALDSGVFDHVFVSTDSQDIANVATSFGAEVPYLRPCHLATDEATTNDVVTHLVEWFEKKHKQKAAIIAILQPTSPLRNAQHIKEAMQLMKDNRAKAIISVCELEYPLQYCNQLGDNGSMEGFINSSSIKRTQEYKSYYRLNGALYFFIREYVGKLSEVYSVGTYSYLMKIKSSIDIDVEDDFYLAEYYMSK